MIQKSYAKLSVLLLFFSITLFSCASAIYFPTAYPNFRPKEGKKTVVRESNDYVYITGRIEFSAELIEWLSYFKDLDFTNFKGTEIQGNIFYVATSDTEDDILSNFRDGKADIFFKVESFRDNFIIKVPRSYLQWGRLILVAQNQSREKDRYYNYYMHLALDITQNYKPDETFIYVGNVRLGINPEYILNRKDTNIKNSRNFLQVGIVDRYEIAINDTKDVLFDASGNSLTPVKALWNLDDTSVDATLVEHQINLDDDD